MNTWFKRFVLIVLLVVSPCAFAQFGVSVLTNNSGGSLAQGSVIVVDSSADKSFTTTTSERATNTIGVVFKSTGIANGATGLILLQGSYVEVVLTTGVITRGDFLITSTTAGRAKSGGTTNPNAMFGFAITASGGGESSVSAILVSTAIAAGLIFEDDEFLLYGTDIDFKIGFVSATPALSWLDGDDNTLMTLADGGTVGNVAITGTLGVTGVTTMNAALALNAAAGITSDEATVALFDIGPTKVDFAGNAAVDVSKSGLATTVKGSLNVDEAVTLDTTLNVESVATFGSRLDMTGAVAAIDASTGMLFLNTINNNDIITGTGILYVKGTLNVDEAVTFDTTLTVSSIVSPVDIGDGTNDLLVAADGFTTLAGTARAVMEMKHTALELLGPGPGNPPAGPNLTGHTFTLDFEAATDEEVFTTMELPHNWAVGTTIKVNFHWAPIDNGAGTVTWGVETKIITPESGTLVEASVATQIVIDDTQTTEDELLVSDMITIDTSGASAHDFLALRIFRDANASEGGASDSYTSDAQLIAFHMEYIVNSFGTDEAW